MMRVLYVTLNVLGDSGANAAELFPRLAALSPEIDRVITADAPRNKQFIRERQFAEFLRLRPEKGVVATMSNALRIARMAQAAHVDVIHIFYRLENVPLVTLLRLAMILLGVRARLLVDHRSVNLARGWRAIRKKAANLTMQVFAHHLAGNPLAVETNHPLRWRSCHVIDLGYDEPPACTPAETTAPPAIWFVGSLKPANRKTEFLVDVFDRLARLAAPADRFRIHVAGPARADQIAALRKNSRVIYHGRLPRADLYNLLVDHPGIGIAFMNREYHAAAPSLKFCEYALMRYRVLASDTPGLRLQARRMEIEGVTFLPEQAAIWAETLLAAARGWQGLQPEWKTAADWSYARIFQRQVQGLYRQIAQDA